MKNSGSRTRRIFRIMMLPLLWLLGVLLSLLLIAALFQYLCAPVYYFPESEPFSGDRLYNPYDSINPENWIKANFQVHSHSYGGVTDGKGSAWDIFRRYDSLGYKLVAISDYQKINPAIFPGWPGPVPNYEHGYGILKNHQLNIGAREVFWFDFVFPQTLSNKQFILDHLHKRADVVVLSHPVWNGAYTPDDVRCLSKYHCIEVVSKYRNSSELWDAALSAGKAVFMTADDDGHNINNPNVVAKCLTLVNLPSRKPELVTRALRYGRAIGVELFSVENEPFADKARRIAKMPGLLAFSVKNDSIFLAFDQKALRIEFIGQGGAIRKKTPNDSAAFYRFGENDTYIRTRVVFPDSTTYFLNPVFRFDGEHFPETHPEINWVKTIPGSALCLMLFLGVLLIVLTRRKRKGSVHG